MCRLHLRRTSQPTRLPLQRTQANMQKRISILIITFTLAISAAAQVGAIDLNRPGSEHNYEQEHEKKQKYTCPMHPEVITDHPGDCPKCGMTLVPKEERKHSTLNSDKSRVGTNTRRLIISRICPISLTQYMRHTTCI